MTGVDARVAGAPGWAELIASLEGLTDEACRVLEPELARFPDGEREVPAAWIDRLADGEPPAALRLCRSMVLTRRRHEEDELDHLLRHPALAGLTRLSLGMDARMLTGERLAGLRSLRALRIETTEPFTSAVRDEQLAVIAGSSALAGLTSLSLDRVDLRGPGVAALARSSTLTALTELELYAPATAAVCKALAVGPAPALRGVQRLAVCADRFTVASAAALAGAVDLLAGLAALELRIEESVGFDWAEPFSGVDGARNVRRLARALTRLLPALRDCEQVTIDAIPASRCVTWGRADLDRLIADPRAVRAALPVR